jgi:hypothetical protein
MRIKKKIDIEKINVGDTGYTLLKTKVYKPFLIYSYIYFYMLEEKNGEHLISGYKDFRKSFRVSKEESYKDVVIENLVELVIHYLLDNGVYGVLKPGELSITDGQLNGPNDIYSDAFYKSVVITGYDEQYDGDIYISYPLWKGQFVVDLDDLMYHDENDKLFKKYMIARSIEMDEWTDFDSFEYPEILSENDDNCGESVKKNLKQIDEQIRNEIKLFKEGKLEGDDVVNIYKLNLKNDIFSILESEFPEDIKVDFDKLFEYVIDDVDYEEGERIDGIYTIIDDFLEE